MNSQNLQNKLRDKFLKKGVKMKGPETVFFSKDTKIGKNVEIEPYVVFADKVQIGNNVKIGGGSGVVKNIEDNQTVMGYPAIPLKNFIRQNKKNNE